MRRNHFRSYRITDHGDVEVVDERGGETVDLSTHYGDVVRDRSGLRLEASLDVFRFADGRITWAASPNGHDTESAVSMALLLRLFLDDLLESAVAPRSL